MIQTSQIACDHDSLVKHVIRKINIGDIRNRTRANQVVPYYLIRKKIVRKSITNKEAIRIIIDLKKPIRRIKKSRI